MHCNSCHQDLKLQSFMPRSDAAGQYYKQCRKCLSQQRAAKKIDVPPQINPWPRGKTRQMACLGCEGLFLSTSKEHRMCADCQGGDPGQQGVCAYRGLAPTEPSSLHLMSH